MNIRYCSRTFKVFLTTGEAAWCIILVGYVQCVRKKQNVSCNILYKTLAILMNLLDSFLCKFAADVSTSPE